MRSAVRASAVVQQLIPSPASWESRTMAATSSSELPSRSFPSATVMLRIAGFSNRANSEVRASTSKILGIVSARRKSACVLARISSRGRCHVASSAEVSP